MGLSFRPWADRLAMLLPPGVAFTTEPGSNMGALLAAIADELDRIDARLLRLIEESDPRTTAEMLPDWESQFGLPEKCIVAPQGYSQRIAALVEKVTRDGGASRQYFIDRALAIGYVVTITEYDPHTVNHHCMAPLTGIDWRFAWRINAPTESIAYFNAMSSCAEPLATWGNDLLECVIRRLAPAHTIVHFAYGE